MSFMVYFEADTHTYTDEEGLVLPSVTQVLKDVGIIDSSKYTEGSAEWGTEIHGCLQRIDEGLEQSELYIGTDVYPYVAAHEQFKHDTGFKVTGVEVIYGSEGYRFAGMIDRIGVLNGKDCIIDIKTGGKENWHSLQLAGYELLLQDPIHYSYVKRYALHLKNTGKYSLIEYKDRTDKHHFLCALDVHHWKREQRNGKANRL